jgi:hypothetical protein
MFPLASTILLELEPVRSPGLFLYPIVAVSAPGAFQPDIFPHQLAPALRRKSVIYFGSDQLQDPLTAADLRPGRQGSID